LTHPSECVKIGAAACRKINLTIFDLPIDPQKKICIIVYIK